MPVTENSSLLFPSCHLLFWKIIGWSIIFQDNKQKIDYFPIAVCYFLEYTRKHTAEVAMRVA